MNLTGVQTVNLIFAGVAVMFYLLSVRLILKSRRAKHRRQNHTWLLVLSTGLIIMITIYLIAQNFFGQEMWIINEGYPGGSGQYYADHAAVWYQTMGSAASVVLSLMSDVFLVRLSMTLFRLQRYDHIAYSLFGFLRRYTGRTLSALTRMWLSCLPSCISALQVRQSLRGCTGRRTIPPEWER